MPLGLYKKKVFEVWSCLKAVVFESKENHERNGILTNFPNQKTVYRTNFQKNILKIYREEAIVDGVAEENTGPKLQK